MTTIYEHLRDSGAHTPWEARPEVLEFAAAMEAKLRKNDHKTGWHDQPIEAHIQYLNIEMAEFKLALEFLTFDDACKELVDIANFALIIRNKLMTQGCDAFRDPPPGHKDESKQDRPDVHCGACGGTFAWPGPDRCARVGICPTVIPF